MSHFLCSAEGLQASLLKTRNVIDERAGAQDEHDCTKQVHMPVLDAILRDVNRQESKTDQQEDRTDQRVDPAAEQECDASGSVWGVVHPLCRASSTI